METPTTVRMSQLRCSRSTSPADVHPLKRHRVVSFHLALIENFSLSVKNDISAASAALRHTS